MGPYELSSKYIDAFNRRDGDLMWSMLDDDVVYVVGGAAPFSGIDAVAAFYAPVFVGDMTAEVLSGVEQDDVVCAEVRLVGSTPDGRSYTVEQIARHRWRDGLLLEYRTYADPPKIGDTQLGLQEFLALMSRPQD